MFSDSDDDSGCVPVFFVSPPAARVPVEETVETKKVEMREEIPSEGTAHLNVLLLQLSALFCKKMQTYSSVLCY